MTSDLLEENADLRKQVADLKEQLEKHKWNNIFLEDCAVYDKEIAEEYKTLQERIADLEKENAELKKQIEKMKCCENCKYNSYWGNELHCNYGLKEALNEDRLVECKEMDKWEIKENDNNTKKIS